MINKLWDSKHQAFQLALKELRNSKGLKQKELGEKLGRHQSYISKYETGERKLDYLELLDILDACENTVAEFHALYLTKVAETRGEYIHHQPKKQR